MQVRRNDARFLGRLEHDGAGAVTEENRGAAIAPVDNATQRLGTDHERAFRIAEFDELVRNRERVDETAAGSFNRERRAIADAEPILQ